MRNSGQGQTIRVVSQETLTSLCREPLRPPQLPPPPCFAPSKSFQSRQGRSVAQSDGCLSFCEAVQYGPSLWRLDKTWEAQPKKGPAVQPLCQMYFWVGMLLFGVGSFFGVWGAKPPRVFLSKVSAAGQRGGYGVWGLGNGLFCWDGFISAPLSCQKQPKSLRSSFTYVRFTSPKKKKKRLPNLETACSLVVGATTLTW